MAYKLVPPRKNKSPYWYVRGTHFGATLDRSTKSTSKTAARKFLVLWTREAETGALKRPGDPTFLEAAVNYISFRTDERFLEPLVEHFGKTLLRNMTQKAIDEAAIKLYPKASPQTRNRQVYTPVSAILKHAGIDLQIRRPKGWRGEARTDWYTTENAFSLFKAADELDREFGIFLKFLCYTGLRLSEALTLEVGKLDLDRGFCYVGKTKNGEPRGIHLPSHLVDEFKMHPRGLDRLGERVFRFRKNGRIYVLMNKVKKHAGLAGLPGKFHIFRHTYGTWMTVHGGLDAEGLVATGVWRDEGAARRYRHTVTSEAARRADLLPVNKIAKSG